MPYIATSDLLAIGDRLEAKKRSLRVLHSRVDLDQHRSSDAGSICGGGRHNLSRCWSTKSRAWRHDYFHGDVSC